MDKFNQCDDCGKMIGNDEYVKGIGYCSECVNKPDVMKLKLYVWEDVLKDYTSGIMFALADSLENAKLECIKAYPNSETVVNELNSSEPYITDSPEGFVVWGGG